MLLALVLNHKMAFSEFFDFLAILKESLILLPKNGKLMAFIAICSVVLYSIPLLLFNCSIKSLLRDLSSTILKPNPSDHMDQLKEIVALLIAENITFALSTSVLSFFFGIATIIVSAAPYTETTLSFKNLFSLIGKTCKRTLVAALYVTSLAIGYFSCVLMLAVPLLIYPNLIALSFAATLGFVGYVLYVYLCVTWGMAIVVSVVEEDGYGVNALGRASALVKGKRVQGFMLNFCFILVVSLVQGFGINGILASPVQGFGINGILGYSTVYGLLMVGFSSFMKIWVLAAYTVLYFHCKKHHGEEMQHGGVQYAKLPTSMLVSSNF